MPVCSTKERWSETETERKVGTAGAIVSAFVFEFQAIAPEGPTVFRSFCKASEASFAEVHHGRLSQQNF